MCRRPAPEPAAGVFPFCRRHFFSSPVHPRRRQAPVPSAGIPPLLPPLLFAAGSSVPPAGSFPFCCRPSFSLPVHPRRRTGPVPAAGTFPLLPPPLLFAAGSSAPPTGPRAIGRCASSAAPPTGPLSAKMPGREMPICRAAPRSCHSADNLAEIADWYDLCLF